MKNQSENPIEIVVWAVINRRRHLVNMYGSDADLQKVQAYFHESSLWHNVIMSQSLYQSLRRLRPLVLRSSRHIFIVSDKPTYAVYDPQGQTKICRSVGEAIAYIHAAPIEDKNAFRGTFIIGHDDLLWQALQRCRDDIDRVVLITLGRYHRGKETFPLLDEHQCWHKADPAQYPRFPSNIFPHEQTVYVNTHKKPLDL